MLVGGATRLPLVRRLAAEIFGREPDTSQPPDEAVALGAVVQAGILEGSLGAVTLLDVTPLSLGIETYGGLMNVIIPRNTTIPAKAGEMFTNAASGQTAMRVRVLQGERELAADNWVLGEMTVEFPPAPRGQARVGVQFELDANGILHVLARDLATGRDTTLDISSAIELSDEAVEKMLADSLEHALEDMDDRRFVEASLKAAEMLPAVEAALATAPPSDPAEIEAIRRAEAATRQALAEKSAKKLVDALEELDRATAPLATRILEAAIAPHAPDSSPQPS
ncbi:MAG: Hsp70 family protein [Terrimicrobiaceae bacterium]|nr:Hsp70 family protein [Terrimicrobiaceae bacterium]